VEKDQPQKDGVLTIALPKVAGQKETRKVAIQ